MTEVAGKWLRGQARFRGIFENSIDGKGRIQPGKFDRKIPLSSMHLYDGCMEYIKQAFELGLDGTQVRSFEEELAKYMGIKYAVAVNSGQAALQLSLKLAAEKLYGSSSHIMMPNGMGSSGCLQGKKVFCSDLATSDMTNPIVNEGGEPVFIDCSDGGCTMAPEVLVMAFEKCPDVKIVVMSEPYGFPGDVLGVRQVCFKYGALLIECVSDSFGASYWIGKDEGDSEYGVWAKAGALGDYCVLDFDRKIIGSSGGAVVVRDYYESQKARYWANGAKADTPWNQHEEFGYQYCMGDLDAAVARGQMKHIDEMIAAKKRIYDRYFEKLDGQMAHVIRAVDGTKPNFHMTVMKVDSNIAFNETRNDREYSYVAGHGTAAPMEISDALLAFNADCSPVYKPMSMQPIYKNHEHFNHNGPWRQYNHFYNDNSINRWDNAAELFDTGIVLPCDIGMTGEEQDKIIDIIYACYDKAGLDIV